MKMTKRRAQKIGSKGGSAVLKKYGASHFSKLAKKRWRKDRNNKKK